MRDFAPFLPVVGALLALLGLVMAFRTGRRLRLVENLPTSKTTGVFIGLVEVKGAAEAAQPLTSYLSEEPCVAYDWSVEEHWSRTVTETYTDKDGKSQTRTRQESGWTTVAGGGEMIPFYIRDDCGELLVQPEGAKLEPLGMFDETCRPGDALYYGKGPANSVSDSDYRRRFVERGLPLHTALYIMGQARERQDVVAAEIAHDTTAPLFLISTRSEEKVRSGLQWGGRGWTLFGLVAVVGACLWRDAALGIPFESRVMVYAAAALGYTLASGLIWVWMVFNSLVELRQRVRQAWSLIDVQLKRRHDLMPNLEAAVKRFRDYERELQSELATLRAESQATPPGVAGPDYAAVLPVAQVIAERYPELKTSESFVRLQQNLSDTEQRIALARGYFNEIATHYNTRLETIPERFVAGLATLKPQALMAANDFERAPVPVNLSPQPSSG